MHQLTRPQFLSLVFLLFLILLLPIVLISNQKQKQLLSKAEEKLIALNATPSATMSPTNPAPSSMPTATRMPTPLSTVTPTPTPQPTPTKIPTLTPLLTPTLSPTNTPAPTSLPTLPPTTTPTPVPPTIKPQPTSPPLTSIPLSPTTQPSQSPASLTSPTAIPLVTLIPSVSPHNIIPTPSSEKTPLDTVVDFFANIFTGETTPSLVAPTSVPSIQQPQPPFSPTIVSPPEEKTIIDTVIDVITAPFRWLFGEREEDAQSDIVFPQSPEILKDKEAVKLYFEIKRETNILLSILEKYEKAKKQGAVPNTLINQMNQQLTHRKNLMLKAAREYPYVFLENTLAPDTLSRFDQSFASSLESSPTTEQGELQVMHIDDFENHVNSRFEYYLQTSLHPLVRYRLYPAGDFPNLLSGSIIKVRGYKLGDTIIFQVPPTQPPPSSPSLPTPSPTPYSSMNNHRNNNSTVFIKSAHAQEAPNQETGMEVIQEAKHETLGGQRVAVILVKEKNATFEPYYSKEQIEEIILKGDVQKFFKEASYGKMWLDEERSKVYGWYEVEGLNINRRDDIEDTKPREIINITDADINFSEFDRIMIGASNSVNTYGGWGNIGKRTYATADGDVYMSFSTFGIGNNSPFVFIHEFGHNLGVYHANSWNCDKGGVEGYCEHDEYGNDFDVMGNDYYYSHHFNAYFKEVFHWLNKPIVDITQSGTYTLHPIEYPETVIAKISRPAIGNFPIYYLETRVPVGFDNQESTGYRINGIHINWRNEPLETRLITLNPNRKDALRQGETFHDEKAGVTITNLNDTTINVELKKPTCTDNNLDVKIDDIYAYIPGSYGIYEDITCDSSVCNLKRENKKNDLELTFVVPVTNHNSYICPDVKVRVALDDPWKKDVEFVKEDRSIASEDTVYFSPHAIISATAPAGTYSILVRVESVDSNQTVWTDGRKLHITDITPILEGDLNNDEKVDLFDLVQISQAFGKTGVGLAEDLNHDGKVDLFDLQLVASFMGKKVVVLTLSSVEFQVESPQSNKVLKFIQDPNGYSLTIEETNKQLMNQGYTIVWDKTDRFTKMLVFSIASKKYEEVFDKNTQKVVVQSAIQGLLKSIFYSSDFSGQIFDKTTNSWVELKEPQKTQIFTQLDQALSALLVN